MQISSGKIFFCYHKSPIRAPRQEVRGWGLLLDRGHFHLPKAFYRMKIRLFGWDMTENVQEPKDLVSKSRGTLNGMVRKAKESLHLKQACFIWHMGKCKKMAPERDIGVKNKYPCTLLFFTLSQLYTYFPRFLIAKTVWGHFCTYPYFKEKGPNDTIWFN